MRRSTNTNQQQQVNIHIVKDAQTYLNISYLLLSFPLGLVYFVFLVTGIVLGLGTFVIWIGAFILPFMIYSWWGLAALERYLVRNMLHIAMPEVTLPVSPQVSFWRRQLEIIKNPLTWKGLLYLILKFPLGLFSFVITFVLSVLSIAIAVVSVAVGLVVGPFFLLGVLVVDSSQMRVRWWQLVLFCISGCGLVMLSLLLFNQLAALQGAFARVMLSMSEQAKRLQEAQQVAARERARAEQAEQRRHELVINVSHELRAPVASIVGHLESLLISTDEGTKTPDLDALYSYLDIAHQEAKRLGTLVDELLSLARMESHELALDIRAVSVRDVVEEVYRALHPLAQQQRRIALVRGYGPDVPPVLADPQRLLQIVLNLVRNAITYTPAGGIVSITVESGAQPQTVMIKVEDNGVGIAAEHLPRLFERFYRVDGSRTRATGGSGLGLAIVKDFVTAMGGHISVSSVEGQGSCFCVVLQVAPSTLGTVQGTVSSAL